MAANWAVAALISLMILVKTDHRSDAIDPDLLHSLNFYLHLRYSLAYKSYQSPPRKQGKKRSFLV